MDDYNLSNYELDNEFNFEKNSNKEEDNLEENHIERSVLNDNLEYNILKPHHSFYKFGITP